MRFGFFSTYGSSAFTSTSISTADVQNRVLNPCGSPSVVLERSFQSTCHCTSMYLKPEELIRCQLDSTFHPYFRDGNHVSFTSFQNCGSGQAPGRLCFFPLPLSMQAHGRRYPIFRRPWHDVLDAMVEMEAPRVRSLLRQDPTWAAKRSATLDGTFDRCHVGDPGGNGGVAPQGCPGSAFQAVESVTGGSSRHVLSQR